MTPVSITFKIEKADKTGRYVAGWLSVVEKDGKVIEDTQGDRISMDELRKGMHGYMAGDRIIKAHHKGEGIGRMIEMVMVDDDFVKAMGATTTKRGAWGTAEITDENVQKSVRENKFSGFSMGGVGKRTPVAKSGFEPLRELDEEVDKARGLLRGGSGPTSRLLDRYRNRTMSSFKRGRLSASQALGSNVRVGGAQEYLARRRKRPRS